MTTNDPIETTKPKKKWSKLKMLFYFLVFLLIGLAALYLFGKREPVSTDVRFDASQLGDAIEEYLVQSEAANTDVLPHMKKEIVWAYPKSKAKTPLSIVYIHGFSASKGETRPVPDMSADALKANLFYTRLKGHGAGSAAMDKASVQDWVDDAVEAIEIGSRLGEKVVVIAVSTGVPLASIAALKPALKNKVAGYILMSPNFKLQTATEPLLTLPYARQWLHLIAGAERSFETNSDLQAKFWTSSYPSTAVLPMAALIKHARTLPFEKIDKPALFIYDKNDRVVDNSVTEQIMGRWGGKTDLHLVEDADDPYNHVLAGDALSPNKNDEIAGMITTWIKQF